ncbi:MAG: glycosyltransferase family 4 protein [Kutzneria sp.]|nr:glycosyltransferase family 4 protein [Kutzneria sp.]
MSNMHLVDVPSCYPPHHGGLELYARELHQHLLAADPELRITVLTSELGASPGTEVINDRLTVVRWPAWEPVSPFPVPKPGFTALLRQCCSQSPNTVLMTHTRFFYHALLVSLWASRHDVRRVHIEHGAGLVESGNAGVRLVANVVDHTAAKYVLRRADAVLAVSESAKRFVNQLAGVRAAAVRRGIDLPDGLVARSVADPPTLCFVGRLISGKGAADLLAAVKTLCDDGLTVHVRICGDGPARAELGERVLSLGLSSQVAFLGAVDHETALREMADCTVFVNPSWTEGLGGTVLEAAALGCAVVATAVGGVPEIVTDGETGWLVPAKRPAELARALRDAIGDADRRRVYGERLRRSTAERFSWDDVVGVVSGMLRGTAVSRSD